MLACRSGNEPLRAVRPAAAFALDAERSTRAYRELQRAVHPDRFAAAPATPSGASRCSGRRGPTRPTGRCKIPVQRAPLPAARCNGVDTGEETNTAMPPDFLMQQMEWRESARGRARRRDDAALGRAGARSLRAEATAPHARRRLGANCIDAGARSMRLPRKLGAQAAVPRQARTSEIDAAYERHWNGLRMALLQIAEPGQSTAPHQHRLAVGIDLGTTNSLVATVRSGIAEVLPDARAARCCRRSCATSPTASVEVGYAAQARAGRRSAEHHRLGQALHGARPDGRRARRERCPTTSSTRPAWCSSSTVAGVKSPVEVSAEILKVLRAARRRVAGRRTGRRRDHRAGLFRRRAAPGDQGRGAARRA